MRDLKILLRLMGFMRPLGGWVAFSVLLSAAAIASGIGLVGTSAYLISAAALRPSIAALQVAIVGVRFFGLSRGILRYLERLCSHSTNFKLLANLRIWFYRQLEPLAPAALWQERSGDLLGRAVSDIDNLENFFVRGVAPAITFGVITFGMGLLIGRFDPQLGLLLVGFLLLAGLAAPLLLSVLGARPGSAIVTRRASLQSALVDGIQGMPDLLAFNHHRAYQEKIETLGRELAHAQRKMGWVSGIQASLNLLLPALGMWSVLAAAIPLVRSGKISGVDLAFLTLASLAAFEAALPLSQAAQSLKSCLASAQRLFTIAGRAPAVVDPLIPLPMPPGTSLEVRGLRFAYAADTPPVLDGIDLIIAPGRRIALVGANGAGKSTLAHLLLRLWEYQQGEILLDGCDLRCLRQEDVRAAISLISQSTYLFDATIRQNLRLARPGASEEQLQDAARQAQIDAFIQSLPQGYDTWVGEHGLRLSGGERQRLAIARALLRQSPILVLDEPTSQLDPAAGGEFLRLLMQVTPGRSLLLITHQLDRLEEMDEILVMAAGKIVERGRHADLLKSGGCYAQMWKLQQDEMGGKGLSD